MPSTVDSSIDFKLLVSHCRKAVPSHRTDESLPTREEPETDIPDRHPDHEFLVTEGSDGERIDSFLARQLRDLSRNQLKKLILFRRVLVNGRSVKPGYETSAADSISVWLDIKSETTELIPQAMDLGILFEDADILVINKPPGLVVHPGAGHREGTLVHGLLAHCPRLASQGAPLRPGIVHRLDQGTSGAMVVAKSDGAYLDLIEQFKTHRVHKEYLALVYGSIREAQGEIRTSMDRHPGDRKKMAVVKRKGHEAISKWKLEKDWGEVSLVQVVIETGRTHQIRVHMSHLHHPIVGDSTYGGGQRRAQAVRSKALQEIILQVHRPMLHSRSLGFLHPSNKTPLQFYAPLPDDFSHLLDTISLLFER
jgi:23S rRNA pseudouridine1911/1915/1917 synthase